MKRKYNWHVNYKNRRKKPTLTQAQKYTKILQKINWSLKSPGVEVFPWLKLILENKEKEIQGKLKDCA